MIVLFFVFFESARECQEVRFGRYRISMEWDAMGMSRELVKLDARPGLAYRARASESWQCWKLEEMRCYALLWRYSIHGCVMVVSWWRCVWLFHRDGWAVFVVCWVWYNTHNVSWRSGLADPSSTPIIWIPTYIVDIVGIKISPIPRRAK